MCTTEIRLQRNEQQVVVLHGQLHETVGVSSPELVPATCLAASSTFVLAHDELSPRRKYAIYHHPCQALSRRGGNNVTKYFIIISNSFRATSVCCPNTATMRPYARHPADLIPATYGFQICREAEWGQSFLVALLVGLLSTWFLPRHDSR